MKGESYPYKEFLTADGLFRVATHRSVSRNLSSQCLSIVNRAQGLVKHIQTWRCIRAEIAAIERRCARLQSDLQQRRASLSCVNINSHRRRTHLRQSNTAMLQIALIETRRRQKEVDDRIVHARRVLVRETFTVFGLNKREIAGLPLPSPDAFRRE